MAPAKKAQPEPKATPAQATHPVSATATTTTQVKKTNTMAVIALVLAIFSLFVSWVFLFALLGLILGIVAKGQIKKRDEGGSGAATAAIVVSIISIILGIVIIVAVIGLGLFAKDQAKKNGVDINSGSINATDKNGNSVSIGNAKLPDGFPSDVPVYTPSKITGSSKYGTNKYTVILTSGDTASKVQDFYKNKLAANGWGSDNSTGSYNFESGTVATFNKGSQQLLVTISSDNKGGENNTTVSLTVYPKDATN